MERELCVVVVERAPGDNGTVRYERYDPEWLGRLPDVTRGGVLGTECCFSFLFRHVVGRKGINFIAVGFRASLGYGDKDELSFMSVSLDMPYVLDESF